MDGFRPLPHELFPVRVRHAGRRTQRRDDVFRVGGYTVLVQVDPVKLSFSRDAQSTCQIDKPHDQHGDRKGRHGDDCAPDKLRLEERQATAIEEPSERRAVVWSKWAGCTILAYRKQAQRQRAPNAADTVDRHCADGIVDAKPLQQLHTEYNDDACNSTKNNGPGGANPVARAGDRYQPRKEAVYRKTDVPFFCS